MDQELRGGNGQGCRQVKPGSGHRDVDDDGFDHDFDYDDDDGDQWVPAIKT